MMFETLEGRRLLSGVVATQVGDTVIYQLPDSGAAIHVIEIGHAVIAQDSSLNPVGGSFVGVNHVIIQGGAGNDVIHYSGDTVGAIINGGAGNDTILVDGSTGASAPAGFIDGGDGNDFIVLEGGTGTIVLGGNGDDTLASAGGMDELIDGGNGRDTVLALVNDSIVTGGNGSDFVAVIGSNDIALGGNGKDVVVTTDTLQVDAVFAQVQALVSNPPV